MLFVCLSTLHPRTVPVTQDVFLRSQWLGEGMSGWKVPGSASSLSAAGLGGSEKASGPTVLHLLGPPEDDEHFKDSVAIPRTHLCSYHPFTWPSLYGCL